MSSQHVARYLRWMVENRPGRTSVALLLAMPLFFYVANTVGSWIWPTRADYTWLTSVYQIAVVAVLAAAVGGLLVLWFMVAMRFWESGKPAERSEWMDR